MDEQYRELFICTGNSARSIMDVVGDSSTQLHAFTNAHVQIANRIRLFLSIPIERLDRLSLQSQLRELGK